MNIDMALTILLIAFIVVLVLAIKSIDNNIKELDKERKRMQKELENGKLIDKELKGKINRQNIEIDALKSSLTMTRVEVQHNIEALKNKVEIDGESIVKELKLAKRI